MTIPTAIDSIFGALHLDTWPPPDQARAFEAATLAIAAYDGHTRDQGTPYLAHPLAVVSILRDELHVTAPRTLLLGLLHDALEISPDLAPRIRAALGPDFAEQLQAMTPDHRLQQRPKHPADDTAWRAKTARLPTENLLIRLADRIHNLRDLRHSPDRRRRTRFLQALDDFYLPLAATASTRSSHLDAAHAVLEAERNAYPAREEEETRA